jgi:hypothetical protein
VLRKMKLSISYRTSSDSTSLQVFQSVSSVWWQLSTTQRLKYWTLTCFTAQSCLNANQDGAIVVDSSHSSLAWSQFVLSCQLLWPLSHQDNRSGPRLIPLCFYVRIWNYLLFNDITLGCAVFYCLWIDTDIIVVLHGCRYCQLNCLYLEYSEIFFLKSKLITFMSGS